MAVVIAIDAGTTGVRAFAVDDGRSPRSATPTASSPSTSPGPGWVEHDAAEIWADGADHAGRAGRPARRAHRRDRHHRPARDGGGVGPAHRHARSTGPSCGRTGAPPARCDALRDGGPRAARAGHHRARARPVLLRHQGGVAAAPRAAWPSTADLALGTVDAWLLWNLTGGVDGGVLATEPSNASRTMLFDIRTLAWSRRAARPASASRAHVLPEVRPSSGRFGVTATGVRPAGGHPGVGDRRRPAGRPVRPGLPASRA